jgi:hypothetical protein
MSEAERTAFWAGRADGWQLHFFVFCLKNGEWRVGISLILSVFVIVGPQKRFQLAFHEMSRTPPAHYFLQQQSVASG